MSNKPKARGPYSLRRVNQARRLSTRTGIPVRLDETPAMRYKSRLRQAIAAGQAARVDAETLAQLAALATADSVPEQEPEVEYRVLSYKSGAVRRAGQLGAAIRERLKKRGDLDTISGGLLENVPTIWAALTGIRAKVELEDGSVEAYDFSDGEMVARGFFAAAIGLSATGDESIETIAEAVEKQLDNLDYQLPTQLTTKIVRLADLSPEEILRKNLPSGEPSSDASPDSDGKTGTPMISSVDASENPSTPEPVPPAD